MFGGRGSLLLVPHGALLLCTLAQNITRAVQALHDKHPGVPVYAVGHRWVSHEGPAGACGATPLGLATIFSGWVGARAASAPEVNCSRCK